jgi:hypothetical protein
MNLFRRMFRTFHHLRTHRGLWPSYTRLPAFQPPSLPAFVAALGITVLGCAATLRAQTLAVPVFDAATYSEAIIEAFDLLQQLANMYFQGTPLPVDMFARYYAFSPFWTFNSLFSAFPSASPVVSALNTGDPTGSGYRQVVDPLDVPTDVLARMPADLQRRFADNYATIQLADSVAAMGIDQTGIVRANGNSLLQVLQSMEADAFSPAGTYQTQTALLDKINSASVLDLKVAEETNQFLSDAVEQLVVDNKRKRDSEAKLMNAAINQWRYGAAYGQDLFSRTATNIDTWRLPR